MHNLEVNSLLLMVSIEGELNVTGASQFILKTIDFQVWSQLFYLLGCHAIREFMFLIIHNLTVFIKT